MSGASSIRSIEVFDSPACMTDRSLACVFGLLFLCCSFSLSRLVSTEAGRRLATSWGCTYIECSAKTDESVDHIFKHLLDQISLLNHDDLEDSTSVCSACPCCCIASPLLTSALSPRSSLLPHVINADDQRLPEITPSAWIVTVPRLQVRVSRVSAPCCYMDPQADAIEQTGKPRACDVRNNLLCKLDNRCVLTHS
jgi:hypothetical protein